MLEQPTDHRSIYGMQHSIYGTKFSPQNWWPQYKLLILRHFYFLPPPPSLNSPFHDTIGESLINFFCFALWSVQWVLAFLSSSSYLCLHFIISSSSYRVLCMCRCSFSDVCFAICCWAGWGWALVLWAGWAGYDVLNLLGIHHITCLCNAHRIAHAVCCDALGSPGGLFRQNFRF